MAKHKRTMAGPPLLLKRKVKKSPKRLGRPQQNKLDLERVHILLDFLNEELKCQKGSRAPKTKRKLDFGNHTPVKNLMLPKPGFYIPKTVEKPKQAKVDRHGEQVKLFEKAHRLAEEVVSDDEDLLDDCHRLAEAFARLKVKKKKENDCEMLETPYVFIDVNEDDSKKFIDACQRSAKKIGASKMLKDSDSKAALIIKKEIPKEIPKDPSENLVIVPKLEESSEIVMPKPNPSAIICIDLTDSPEIVSKSVEKNPEKLGLLPKPPTENKPENLGLLPTPLEKNPEKLGVLPKPSPENKPEKLPTPLEKKPSSSVPKPPDNKTEKKSEKQGLLPKPSAKIAVQGKNNGGVSAVGTFRFSNAGKKTGQNYNNPTGRFYVPPQRQIWCQPMPNKRFIIVDGSNVAFAHGNSSWFSSEGVHICLQYFESRGHRVKAVMPLFRRNAFQSSNPQLLEQLHRMGKIVFTPCKNFNGQKSISYDDRFILQLAHELDAAVVSNDNYRDLMDENPGFSWIVQNRVIGYTWCDNIFMLPKDPYGRRRPSLDEILHY